MKRIITAAAFISLVVFASCKKDYTCECVTTDNAGNNVSSSITIHATKADADTDCSGKATSNSSGSAVITTCSIK
jgi:hypothetical protein